MDGALRLPTRPCSVIGVRPAANKTGVSLRDAFMMPIRPFAVPTLTHHGALRFARHQVIAVCHCYRYGLVQDLDRVGYRQPIIGVCVRLNQRREIGAGVTKNPINAARFQRRW